MMTASAPLAVDCERCQLTLGWGAASVGTVTKSSSPQKAKAERQWCVTNVCTVVRVKMGGTSAVT